MFIEIRNTFKFADQLICLYIFNAELLAYPYEEKIRSSTFAKIKVHVKHELNCCHQDPTIAH